MLNNKVAQLPVTKQQKDPFLKKETNRQREIIRKQRAELEAQENFYSEELSKLVSTGDLSARGLVQIRYMRNKGLITRKTNMMLAFEKALTPEAKIPSPTKKAVGTQLSRDAFHLFHMSRLYRDYRPIPKQVLRAALAKYKPA